jgi:hypothetical protein
LKQLLILALLLVTLVIPASVQAVTYDSSTLLENKDTTTWEIIVDGKSGTLQYNESGATFSYSFTATGLEDGIAYSLIYYANPYPGNFPGKLIGTGTAGTDGALTITGTPNLNMNLPTPPDSNMVVDHSGAPDNYAHAYGAKIWLVPSTCYDGAKITVWTPARFLFETDLISYTDTDLVGGTTLTTTATVTEPTATIGLTVSPASLAFGSVAIGSCSSDIPITLTNTGNVPIKVTASPSAGINATCMQLQPTGGTYTSALGWVSPVIPAGVSLVVNAKLCPTIAFSGSVPGTIGFNASFAAP